jgi:hypothetical protein
MGIKKNFNPPGECECKSEFNIQQEINLGGFTGTLFLRGEICPDCENRFSNFTLSFEDNDLTNGDQSFKLKPLAINPPCCELFNIGSGSGVIQYFGQRTAGIGIFKPRNDVPVAVGFVLQLLESITPDTDDIVSISIFSPQQLSTEFVIFSCSEQLDIQILATNVPNEDIVITEC